jgi:hypothetical protein
MFPAALGTIFRRVKIEVCWAGSSMVEQLTLNLISGFPSLFRKSLKTRLSPLIAAN